MKPVILKYTNPSDETDTCYYLALLYTKGNWNNAYIHFNGVTSDDIIGTYIEYTDSLPDGYEIYREPLSMRKLNLVSGYIGNDDSSYSYADIKALEDRISVLEKV